MIYQIIINIILVQGLKEANYHKRLNFCRFVRKQTILDQNFLENVLFSDEAYFSNNCSVNKHISRARSFWDRVGYDFFEVKLF
jgi:hypothetical protein